MLLKIGCIVEGQGDVAAVPVMIRRIAAERYPEMIIDIHRPIRVNRNQVVLPDQLEQEVELAAERIGGNGAIFIIFDSDDDCPAELGPALLYRASQVRDNLPIAVVLAKREFEAWFLASAESLSEKRGLKNDLQSPNNPEAIRNAKGWLSGQMEVIGDIVKRATNPHSQQSLTLKKHAKQQTHLTNAIETSFASLKNCKRQMTQQMNKWKEYSLSHQIYQLIWSIQYGKPTKCHFCINR